MDKTEKSLDEQVAEALGLRILTHGFFTQSIANGKKYIEPVLLQVKGLIELDKCGCGEVWIVQGIGVDLETKATIIFFKGIAETEEIAYCKALLDLKAMGK